MVRWKTPGGLGTDCGPLVRYNQAPPPKAGARDGFAGVEGAPGQSQVARQVQRAVAYHAAGD
eukprot:7391233-Pyramimonas_sp.AAC.1